MDGRLHVTATPTLLRAQAKEYWLDRLLAYWQGCTRDQAAKIFETYRKLNVIEYVYQKQAWEVVDPYYWDPLTLQGMLNFDSKFID